MGWSQHATEVYGNWRRSTYVAAVPTSPVADRCLTSWPPGHPYQTLVVERAEVCRSSLLAHGLIGASELDRAIAELREHLNRPDTVVLHATLFQAWGRVHERR